jgi:hemerythrin
MVRGVTSSGAKPHGTRPGRKRRGAPTGAAPPAGEPAAAGEEIRIAWKPEYAVGIEEIDAQHQELFRRAGLFADSLKRQSRQEIGILLSFLRLYAVTHFGAEEAWMRRAKYPRTAEHQKLHDGFMKDILALSDQHEKPRGTGIDPARVIGWLEKWLKHHVSEMDTDLARHLRETGTPPPEPSDPPF